MQAIMRPYAPWTLTLLGLPLTLACGNDDISATGTYTTEAVWDLSAPFGRDGIGGAFADLLIEQSVSAAVPGFLEDEALDLTSSLIRDPIKGLVEDRLPDDLKQDGVVLIGLRDALGAVQVQTALQLDDNLEGRERITRLTVPTGDSPFVLNADDLPEGVAVEAELKAKREARDRIELRPYDLQLRYGDFVLILVGDLLHRDVAALTAQTEAAIPCDVVVEEITGGDGSFEFEVAKRDFRISAGALLAACDVVKDTIGQYALGLVRLDSGVQLGGQVTLLDTDLDGEADGMSSDTDFEGRITLLPGPFEPRFSVNFVGQRR